MSTSTRFHMILWYERSCTVQLHLLLALSESRTDWQSGQLKPYEVTSKSTDERGREEQERESQKERERERASETERNLEGGGEEHGSHYHVQGCFDCDEVARRSQTLQYRFGQVSSLDCDFIIHFLIVLLNCIS